MGHIRLGTLPQSKKWREVVDLLEADASLDEVAAAAARASELDLGRASDDPAFQHVTSLLVQLPFWARSPGFDQVLAGLNFDPNALSSVSSLLANLSGSIDQSFFELGGSSDAGELARSAFLETLSVELRHRLPSLFEPTPQEIRKALASFSSGANFAPLARAFFAKLTYKSLDYYLSRELANHTGANKRFSDDAQRREFESALAQHTVEASRIVEEFAGGWYGKTIWKEQNLDQEAINKFTRYAFKKMRSELVRRREIA
ncbi:hypothetical protein [Sneathiella sp. HT1-7]|uniref:hypothetical protein n=1 Tax=Sneathiella sp. HT1-7 TaxID=2887192 RepID=UPI001D135197|nr:hypothetical protein [Sneathiella sp. HT1-7]MCC3306224.1 hypothetical protein [Sneathiella sp. HT1-7]